MAFPLEPHPLTLDNIDYYDQTDKSTGRKFVDSSFPKYLNRSTFLGFCVHFTVRPEWADETPLTFRDCLNHAHVNPTWAGTTHPPTHLL